MKSPLYLAFLLAFSAQTVWSQTVSPEAAFPDARAQLGQFDRIHSVVAAHRGEIVFSASYRGDGLRAPTNIKSVSKTVLSSLVGIAIEEGVFASTDEPVARYLEAEFPANPDPRLYELTLGDLASMRAGLESTSGGDYGPWVVSDNWVEYALAQPFETDPGARMIYSTGSTHLLSAALTRASGESTWSLAQQWLARPLNVRIPQWLQDPQGIYFGGNDMVLSPLALLWFGEMYRNNGRVDGEQVVPADWVEASWTARGTSPWTNDDYGYGWFITDIADSTAYYGRGYGGQFLYVLPEHEMTIVVTSDPTPPSPGSRYLRAVTRVLENTLIPGVAGSNERG